MQIVGYYPFARTGMSSCSGISSIRRGYILIVLVFLSAKADERILHLMDKEDRNMTWKSLFPILICRSIQKKSSWRLKLDEFALNRNNGFLLIDALVAAVVGVLFLSAALLLTSQAVTAYRQARHIISASSIGRSEMEAMRWEEKNFCCQKTIERAHELYGVNSQIEPIDGRYVRHRVEVQDPDEGVHVFIRLAEAKK